MNPEDALKVVFRPYVTEKTFDLIERQNKICFLVEVKASKKKIKSSIETLYQVKVASVNTAITIVGKKAFVRLAPESSATDLASKLGLV
ncbi:MAG TPA: 50S ribosomal protein L23 [Nitrososphaerales archaeon]|nr:50S ribosomal protein L23 [Nitrososphaerales archaeon]